MNQYEYAVETSKRLLSNLFPNDWEDMAHDAYIKYPTNRRHVYQYLHQKKYQIIESFDVLSEDMQIYNLEDNDKIIVKELLKICKQHSTEKEFKVLMYRIQGYSYDEIAKELQVSKAWIGQIFNQIHFKLLDREIYFIFNGL